MAAPTFSPDGQWMWNGEEWIPAPPGSQHDQGSESVYPTLPSVKQKIVNAVENVVGNGNDAAVEQLTILIDQLRKKNTLYKKQKKIRNMNLQIMIGTYLSGLLSAWLVMVYGSEGEGILPPIFDISPLIVAIGVLIFGLKKRSDRIKKMKIKGKPKVRIWHLTTSVKAIDPLIAMHTHHPSMAKYVEIKSEIQSNFMATMLIGAAGTAVGVGALTVIASQMKKK